MVEADTTDNIEVDETVYKILKMIDEDILVMSSTSVLEVDVYRTAPGGESPT